MPTNKPQKAYSETFVAQTVTHILETKCRMIVVKNVPARVSPETGEQSFSPETVARLQQTAWGNRTPTKVLETPVFKLSA